MSIGNINVEESIKNARELMEKENISPALRAALEVILLLVQILIGKLGLNSKNSSLPPSQDPNRKRKELEKENGEGKKRGGQKGRKGVRLVPVENPDEEREIPLDKNTLPEGHQYKRGEPEKRQVFDIIISTYVTQYNAEVWIDERGKKYTATFPEGVTQQTQYGNSVKSHAVYLSTYQLLPTKRISEYFGDKFGFPISEGSICNWNREAGKILRELKFPELLKEKLIESEYLNLDETGQKIGTKTRWLHNASNKEWTYLFSHPKRGKQAMDEMGILEKYGGVMIHDHWKPYYGYEGKTHSLCNAHHLRELQGVIDKEEKHQWAKNLKELLIETKFSTEESGGVLSREDQERVRKKYREIIEEAEKPEGECPPPKEEDRPLTKDGKKRKGRLKKSKARNLLERFKNFEDDVLRFMTQKNIPFTNNLGERDLRMTKVKQKISGCFQSEQSAQDFALIRSFIGSAKKQNLSPSSVLNILFEKKLVWN